MTFLCVYFYYSLQKVAKKYKKHKNMAMVKIDALVNDVPPQFYTHTYPTIYFATR